MKLVSRALLIASSLLAATTCLGMVTTSPDCGTNLALLTVGTQFGIPPYEVLVAGVPSGFDVDIACELRKRLGFQNITFKMINPLDPTFLNTGAVTITISALNEINPTSLAAESLVKYSDFAYGLLFNGAIPARYSNPSTALANLITDDKNIGVIANSFEIPLLTALGVDADDIIPFDTVTGPLGATNGLKTGAITAFFSNNVVVNTANSSDPTLTPLDNVVLPTSTAAAPFTSVGLGIAVSNVATATGNTACCQLYVNIHAAIKAMVADGTYAALATKNGVPTTFTEVDFTPAACTGTTPMLVMRNNKSTFIFNKYCVCKPTVTPSTMTPVMVTASTVTPSTVKPG